MLKKLQAKNPDRNVAFIAIEELTEPKEIKRFYKEYIEWLSVATKNPSDMANQNLGYILAYYGDDTNRIWRHTIPEIYHPVPFIDRIFST